MTVLFWVSAGIIAYVYVGYPLLLSVLARHPLSHHVDEFFLPRVSLVIAAHNEEQVLREKLENSLALDYPKQKLEIFVASDGSTDATNSIAKDFDQRGVVLCHVVPRGGKARALGLVVPKTQGEVIVLSDANTMYRPDAIRQLVCHFADPLVGAVSGDVRLVDAAESYADSEGLYYRYERWIQKQESRIGSIIGADGAMYAITRRCFAPAPSGTILDDFVVSMNVARKGLRVLYEPKAIGIEQGTQSGSEEFRRKIRIVAGGMQALKMGEGLPRLQQPSLLLGYVSHKLLRWFIPYFLGLALLSSVMLARGPFYLLALLGQLAFYGLALGYALAVKLGLPRPSWASVPFYFCLVNAAAFIGTFKGLLKFQTGMWQRTER